MERRVLMRSITRVALCFAFLVVGGIGVAGPSVATPPDLTVTALFDKASYVSGEQVSVKFSVHNSGTTAATGITAGENSGPTDLAVDRDGFGVFDDGATVPAGGTVTLTVSGELRSLVATKVTFAGYLYDRSGSGVAYFSTSAPVTIRTGTVSGLVFGDANANGRADSGEGLSGVKVR